MEDDKLLKIYRDLVDELHRGIGELKEYIAHQDERIRLQNKEIERLKDILRDKDIPF